MAQSRVQKTGSIFYRVTGLLRSGVVKWNERPAWYDVYAAHPPLQQPLWNRKPAVDVDAPIRPIYYAEDVVRAHFYKTFANQTTIDLKAPSSSAQPSVADAFVKLYMRQCDDLAALVAAGVDPVLVEQCAVDVEKHTGVRLVTAEQVAAERVKRESLRSESYTAVQSRRKLTKAQQHAMLDMAITALDTSTDEKT